MLSLLAAAEHDPASHVLPHKFFTLLPFNFNFGLEQVPILGFPFGGDTVAFTNQMLMMLVAAVLVWLSFRHVARFYAAEQGMSDIPKAPRGVANLLELLLQFIREEVARPVLGHRTDQFAPFLWTLFFFILFCNLLGMIPLAEILYLISGRTIQHVGGTATGNLAVTGALAIVTFFMIHISGIRAAYTGLVDGTYGHHDEGHEHEHAHDHSHAESPLAPGGEEGMEMSSATEEIPPAVDHKRMPANEAAIWAVPLYIWNFAPHVFAPKTHREAPNGGLRIAMVIVYAIIMAFVMRGIFGLLAGDGGALVGTFFGVLLGVIAGFCAGGLSPADLIDAPMWGFLLLLEFLGALIKPFALMIRLFANMVAGHIVLASLLLLIPASMSYFVGVTSAAGCVAISLLELFVAFLQAYIFVFLSTLFIGMAVAPEH